MLGEEAAKLFCTVYDVTDRRQLRRSPEHSESAEPAAQLADVARTLDLELADLQSRLAAARQKLLAVRKQRIPPGLDDKVLVSWNGLMIDAMASAAGALGEPRYLAAAQKAADFILTKLRKPDGRLLHAYRHGQAKFDGYLDDYACLANALVSLYEADFDARWINEAGALCDVMLERFSDKTSGGFFYTADDHEELIARNKDVYDNATPSGTGMALTVLVRLGKLTGIEKYAAAAERGLQSLGDLFERAPTAVGQSMLALDLWLGPTQELVVAAPDAASRDEVLRVLRRQFRPHQVTAAVPNTGKSELLAGILAGKQPVAGKPALYICENFTCQAPIVGLEAIAKELTKPL